MIMFRIGKWLKATPHTSGYNTPVCRSRSSTSKASQAPGVNAFKVAVVAGGRHATGPHEAWIAADPFNGGFRVLITGPHGFERTVTFAIDDDPAVITERVRETMEE